MKRWLRANSVPYSVSDMYSEAALRKKVRTAIARVGGAA